MDHRIPAFEALTASVNAIESDEFGTCVKGINASIDA
jgi:hypothetical protein